MIIENFVIVVQWVLSFCCLVKYRIIGVVDNFYCFHLFERLKEFIFLSLKIFQKKSCKNMRATLACLLTCLYCACVIYSF